MIETENNKAYIVMGQANRTLGFFGYCGYLGHLPFSV